MVPNLLDGLFRNDGWLPWALPLDMTVAVSDFVVGFLSWDIVRYSLVFLMAFYIALYAVSRVRDSFGG